jgi:hypothetical protein
MGTVQDWPAQHAQRKHTQQAVQLVSLAPTQVMGMTAALRQTTAAWMRLGPGVETATTASQRAGSSQHTVLLPMPLPISLLYSSMQLQVPPHGLPAQARWAVSTQQQHSMQQASQPILGW